MKMSTNIHQNQTTCRHFLAFKQTANLFCRHAASILPQKVGNPALTLRDPSPAVQRTTPSGPRPEAPAVQRTHEMNKPASGFEPLTSPADPGQRPPQILPLAAPHPGHGPSPVARWPIKKPSSLGGQQRGHIFISIARACICPNRYNGGSHNGGSHNGGSHNGGSHKGGTLQQRQFVQDDRKDYHTKKCERISCTIACAWVV